MFDEVMSAAEPKEDQLKTKLNYFYGPNAQKFPVPKCMYFDNSRNVSSDSFAKAQIQKSAHLKWEKISNGVFSEDPNKFRGFLKSVNNNMYSKLVKLGERCCSSNPSSKYKRSNSKLSNSNQKEVKKGIKMLREIIQQKVFTRRHNPNE